MGSWVVSRNRPRSVGQRQYLYCRPCGTKVVHEGDRKQFSKAYHCLACGTRRPISSLSKRSVAIGPRDWPRQAVTG